DDRLTEFGRDRPFVDLSAHLGVTGGNPLGLADAVVDRLDRLDVDLGPQLETVEAGEDPIAPAPVGVEHELLVGDTTYTYERVDLPLGLEDERQRLAADRQSNDVLRQLALQERLGVGPAHANLVADHRVFLRAALMRR